MLFLLLACTNSKEQDNTTTETTGVFIPSMPQSECGLAEYNFLSTETMGELTSVEKQNNFSMEASAIQILLSSYEFPLPAPTYSVDTYYIQYKSQDKGQEILGTGIISFPRDIENAQVILWPHPTMGFTDECAPTATGLIGAAYPVVFASLGFIVISPDYLGMSGWTGESEELHPYIVAEPTAILSIDALRALPRLIREENIDVSFNPNEIILWGASEGGYAALFIDRYLPHYAPEFQSIATIAAIPATDPFALAQHGVTTFGPTSAGIIGAQVGAYQWYDSTHSLEEILQPSFAEGIIDAMYESCSDFPLLEGVENLENVFTQEYIDGILSDDGSMEPWTCFLKENSITRTKLPLERTAPTYITTAENDDLAIPAPVHADIQTLCGEGYQIVHRQCAGAGHVAGATESLAEQWIWLQARLNGDISGDICQVQDPAPCAE